MSTLVLTHGFTGERITGEAAERMVTRSGLTREDAVKRGVIGPYIVTEEASA